VGPPLRGYEGLTVRYFSEDERRAKEERAGRLPAWLQRSYHRTRTVHDAYDEQLGRLVNGRAVLLDAGCGKKGIMQKYRGQFGLAVGIDMDIEALKQNACLDRVVVAGAGNLPFGDACFDVVITQWLFEHLPDPHSACREFRRVLRPGGHLIVVTNSRYCPMMALSWALPLALRDRMKKLVFPTDFDEDTFPTPYRCNSLGEFRRTLGGLGFRRISEEYAGDVSIFLFAPWAFAVSLLYERVTDAGPLRCLKMHTVVHYQLASDVTEARVGSDGRREPGTRTHFESILACPVCKAGVEQDGDGYRCAGCDARYPVRDHIPVMLGGEP